MSAIDVINQKAFDEGIAKFRNIIYEEMRSHMVDLMFSLINALPRYHSYQNITGNAYTSNAAGLYFNGQLTDIVLAADALSLKPPVRIKMTRNEGGGHIKVDPSYDGPAMEVSTTKFVKTDRETGIEGVKEFLRGVKPSCTNGWSVILANGIEYAEILAKINAHDLLSDTFLSAPDIFKNCVKGGWLK